MGGKNSKDFNPKTDRHETALFKTQFFVKNRWVRKSFFETVEELESELGRAPYGCEIGYRYRTTKAWIGVPPMLHNYILNDMARDDILYTDAAFDQYATEPSKGLKKASEIFLTDPKFEGLKVDENGLIVPDTRTCQNFQQLKAALLGPVEEGKAYAAIFLDDKKLRFLDGQSIDGDRVCYQTIPRSGNTFLRKYLELITNVPTGSDASLKVPMPLQLLGNIGEAIADDRTWIIKSHQPFRIPDPISFSSNRIIVTVRNPFDIAISMSTFYNVWSHSKQIENKFEEEEPEWFEKFIKAGIFILAKFQEDILQKVKDKNVPIMFLKFEELRKDPKEPLLDVFRFLLGQKDLAGTYVEHKINEVLALGHSATQQYKMKNTDGKFCAIDRFNEELQEIVKTQMAPYCQFFDYFKTEGESSNEFQYFDPPKGWTPDPELGNYKDATREAINWVDGTTLEERQAMQIRYEKQMPVMHQLKIMSQLRYGETRVKDP